MSTSPSLPAGFFITSIGGKRCTAVPRASTTLTGSAATQAAAQPPTTILSNAATTTAFSASAIDSAAAVTPLVSSYTNPVAISIASIPQAQSEISVSTTRPSFTILNGSGFTTSRVSTPSSIIASSTSVPSSSAGSITSKISAGPVIGGVLGSLGFVSLIAFLFWFLRRRRRDRDSLLTPLASAQRTSFYDGAITTEKVSRWKFELGSGKDRVRNADSQITGRFATLKYKVKSHHRNTPSVNLNRGNSQFLDGSVHSHTRNNSSVSTVSSAIVAHHATFREKVVDALENLGEKFAAFKWSLPRRAKGPSDNFGGMNEKQAGIERDTQMNAEAKRTYLPMGGQGLNVGSENPFADPTRTSPTYVNPFADPTNPFSDPPTPPQPTAPKTNTYVSEVRRSRGQSVTANNTSSIYRPPPSMPGSRYPSTLAPSRNSYRDTVITSASGNWRDSDPFDLEVPAAYRPSTNSLYPQPLNPARANTKAQGILGMDIGGQPGKRITYGSSKYSSGSGLSEWGDPGPDIGSLASEGVLGNGMGMYQAQPQNRDEVRRSASKASSKGGVGKAW